MALTYTTDLLHTIDLAWTWPKEIAGGDIHCICYINGLVQGRRNSNALALELRLSCTNPSIWEHLCFERITFEYNILRDFIYQGVSISISLGYGFI